MEILKSTTIGDQTIHLVRQPNERLYTRRSNSSELYWTYNEEIVSHPREVDLLEFYFQLALKARKAKVFGNPYSASFAGYDKRNEIERSHFNRPTY